MVTFEHLDGRGDPIVYLRVAIPEEVYERLLEAGDEDGRPTYEVAADAIVAAFPDPRNRP